MSGKAKRIVKAIEDDLNYRRGLRQAWEQIESDVLTELRKAWIEIVQKELDKP